LVVDSEQDRVLIRFSPIQGKVGVSEACFTIQIDRVKPAEVVGVELEEVGEDRLLVRCGGNQFDGATGLDFHGGG
jgi:hypothetical protein